MPEGRKYTHFVRVSIPEGSDVETWLDALAGFDQWGDLHSRVDVVAPAGGYGYYDVTVSWHERV